MLVLPVSDQIILQVSSQDAVVEIAALVQRNLEHLRAWMPWAVDDYSTKHAAEWIEAVGTVDLAANAFAFLIRDHGSIIGTVGVHDVDSTNRHAKVGYWIDRAHEGKGIVTRCCRVLLDHLFDTINVNRVQINCNVDNNRSRAIPERLGFTIEGTLREVELLRGEFRDQVVYSLLKREWLANRI